MSEVNIVNCLPVESAELFEEIKEDIEEFARSYAPLESKSLYILVDNRTNAIFCECHVLADKLLSESTTKVPLDPEEQLDYPANRELVDDTDPSFSQMIQHAEEKRSFSNIVCEYTNEFDTAHPLKIVGGQHRYTAIELASKKGVNEYHGIKVYFGLDPEQRMDVQLISNTNIDISPDLLDRVFETYAGPELRDWCHSVGLLEDNKDFADKRQQGPPINVRTARTFIMNYYNGLQIPSNKFDDLETLPVIGKTGVSDPDWEKLKLEHPDVWSNQALQESAKEFAQLAQAQKLSFDRKKKKDRKDVGYSEVAYNFSFR